jgi:hypothetical protein
MYSMRHPLLRILVALLIGVVTPLCCCQAAALAGGACAGKHVAAAESDSCCGGRVGETRTDEGPAEQPCQDQPRDDSQDQSQDRPDHDQPSPPGKCPSCPSCQGTSAGTGISAEARLPAFEQQWNALATFALAVLWTMEAPEALVAPHPPGWAHYPPHLKANRDAQRWHCALLV